MSARDDERLILIEDSTWRQTALPAGRIALVRGTQAMLLLAVAYFVLAPLGPESGPAAMLMASHWTPNSDASTASTLQGGLLSLLSILMPVDWASKLLVMVQVALALAVLVSWLRQLDASRSTVVPTALIAGLSPGICHLVAAGGDAPLLFFLGALLLVATDQVRAEAGRGIFFVGVLLGVSLLIGPEMFPVQLYALLTMLFDRGLRGLGLRGFALVGLGCLIGCALVIAMCALQTSAMNFDFSVGLNQLLDSWNQSINSLHLPAIEVLMGASQQLGILFAIMSLPGLVWATFRRPGDTALLLLVMTSGAFVAPDPLASGSPTLSPEQIDRFVLFSTLPALVFCSWTLTLAHRSLARFQPSKNALVIVSSILLCLVAAILVKPPLWKSESQLVRQWSTAVLELAPPEALLLTGGGEKAAALEAVQWLDQIRPDVTILDPWGKLLPHRIGLQDGVDEDAVRTAIGRLLINDRPLILLPGALSHSLVAGANLQPRALLFEIRPHNSPLQSDRSYWDKVELNDLPADPEAAMDWLRGSGNMPPRRGRLAGRIAADAWLAKARSNRELTFSSRWAPILTLLEDLQRNPDDVEAWLKQQGDEFGQPNPDRARRSGD